MESRGDGLDWQEEQYNESKVIWDEQPFAFVSVEGLYKDLQTGVSQSLCIYYASSVPHTIT